MSRRNPLNNDVEAREYIQITAQSLPVIPKTRKDVHGNYNPVITQRAVSGNDILRLMPAEKVRDWETEQNAKIEPSKLYLIDQAPDTVNHLKAMTKAFKKQGMAGVARYVNQVKRISISLDRQNQ